MCADAKGRGIAAAALLAAALGLGLAAQQKPAAAKAAAPPKSLILMDWLKAERPPLGPPQRDVFSPSAFAPALPVSGPGSTAAVPPGQPNPETKPADAAPAFALQFIGFSRSVRSGKIVALVIIDGQPAAVEEGETLPQGYKIIRISPKEIEAQGPDGKSHTVPLAGAER
jgi:hypothetical protein